MYRARCFETFRLLTAPISLPQDYSAHVEEEDEDHADDDGDDDHHDHDGDDVEGSHFSHPRLQCAC